MPGLSTAFTVTVTAKNGEETLRSNEYSLVLHDDVFARTVECDGEYTDVYFPTTSTPEYTEEKTYNGVGALHLTNYTAGAGDIAIRLLNRGTVPQNSKFSFYVYNPSGLELTSYIFTRSNYWGGGEPGNAAINLGGILTDMVKIPAEEGWHKVTLTLKPQYDGGFGSITLVDEINYSEIRLVTSDWKYNGETPFNLYVSNVYLETTHTEAEISYNANGFIETGVKDNPFNLPYAESNDKRYNFEYSLTSGGNPVTFDETAFSFTPAAAGEYVYTVKSFWRDTEVAEKTYNFNVLADDFVLNTASYYQYNAESKVTLPEAIVAGDKAGKPVTYSVTPVGGEKVVLGDDRVYTVPANGEYVYRAEIIEDSVVLDFDEKTIKIHDGRVLLDCGISGDNVNSDLVVVPATQQSYTTEVAAPGELGALKIDNANFSEKGNFWVGLTKQLSGSSVTQLVFWIKHTGSEPLNVRMYSPETKTYADYWYKGSKYTAAEGSYPITGSDEWQKIEFIVYAAALTTNDIRLQITTNTTDNLYPWTEGEEPVIYISNIYYR